MMKPSDPVRPALTPGAPFFDEQYALHVTSFRDVADVAELERKGYTSGALSLMRVVLGKYGIVVPERVHASFLFPWAQGLFEADGSPGRHPVLRGVLAEYLTRDAITDLRSTMEEFALELVRENVREQQELGGDTGRIDLAGFASTLAFRSMSALAGFPYTPEDEAFMLRHLTEFANLPSLEASFEPEPQEVRDYFQKIIDQHKAAGKGGLLGRIIAAHEAGDISLDERNGLIWGCWAAGRDTTATLIALLFGLVDEENLQGVMVQKLGPEGTGYRRQAIEEALRFTPFGSAPGISVKPFTVGDLEVPPKTRLILHWETANRDPEVWGADAHRYNPDRREQPNLGFGHGLHYCLGAGLARAEADVAARVVYGKLPGLQVTRWNRLARLIDVVDTCDAEYDLPAAAQQLGLN